jgi:hypothetical protein
MTLDDREMLGDIRGALHGVVMKAGQLEDQQVFEELEKRIDGIIRWLRGLDKKSFPAK